MDTSTTQLSPPLVLVFAASDPSSGAGIQADLMSLSSMSCHPLTALTAITVQDSVGVEAVLPLDARWVEAQARAVLEDIRSMRSRSASPAAPKSSRSLPAFWTTTRRFRWYSTRCWPLVAAMNWPTTK